MNQQSILSIPEEIATAATVLLERYAPGLTPEKLACAITYEPDEQSIEKLLSSRETSVAFNCSVVSVDRMLRDGELKRIRVRGRVFIRQSEIDRIISGEGQS